MNTIEYANVFMSELDNQLVECSTTGWMEENAGQVQYNGGAEVKIPKIVMNGLGNYDRNDGFAKGSVTLNYETMSMGQDRGRTFQLDAMDVNETNFSLVAGSVMGEFQRSKVIPEIDAYRYSSIFAAADKGGKTKEYTPDGDTIFAQLMEDITDVRDVVGDGAEIVISMSAKVAGLLDASKGGSNAIQSAVFSQGNAEIKVKEIDNCPLIRVPSARFKTEFDFIDGVSDGNTDGGFAPSSSAKELNWIISVKSAPIAVSKTDVTRIFDPMTNQNANAWKIDYRKYHDLWITENALEGIIVSVGGSAGE